MRRARMFAIVCVFLLLGPFLAASSHRDADVVTVALVTGLSGSGAQTGRMTADSVQMMIDGLNDRGGIRGLHVELEIFDDQNDPRRAVEIARKITSENRALAVIGHRTSDTSAAAAPVYAAAGIPMITPSATASSVVAGHDGVFRTIFSNRTQNAFLLAYLKHVMRAKSISVVYGDDIYGRDIRDGLQAKSAEFEQARFFAVDYKPGHVAESVRSVVSRLRELPADEPVVLALQETQGVQVIEALRGGGVHAPLLTTEALASEEARRALREGALNRRNPGAVFKDVFLVAPLVNDALSGPAIKWSKAFEKKYGYIPGWQGATAHDALSLVLRALDNRRMSLTPLNRAADRDHIRAALASMTSPHTSVPGLLAPMYFDRDRSLRPPIAVATTDGHRLISTPLQHALYEPAGDQRVTTEIAAGKVIDVDGVYLTPRQVVAVGIAVNQVRDLNTKDGRFFADFFLWLRYVGDDAVTQVSFANSADPALTLPAPLRVADDAGVKYALYRVSAEFKATFDFHDFPFDRQDLRVVIGNLKLPSSRVVYVTDKAILDRAESDTLLQSGADERADITAIPNWLADSVQYFQDTVGTSIDLGDPSVKTGRYYNQYGVEITVARDLSGFLTKNLLPLLLLVVVVYFSFFLSAREISASVSIGVSAVLGTAVLLQSVTADLPDVNYTVAIEWGYYAFILLAVCSVLAALIRWRIYMAHRFRELKTVDLFLRTGYVLYVGGTACAYFLIYG